MLRVSIREVLCVLFVKYCSGVWEMGIMVKCGWIHWKKLFE